MKSIAFSRGAALAALLLAAACTDRTPTESAAPAGEEVRAQIACTASVANAQVRCGLPGESGGPAASIIVGGQGTYLRLESSNVAYDSATDGFSLDVTVQNLLSQQMGTPDGTTVSGVQVFFDQEPVATEGSGEVTIANADGEGDFTRIGQPYFEYPQILEPRGASQPRTWRFDVPGSVQTFRFTVYVRTELPAEQGVLRWLQEEGAASVPVTHVRALWGASAGDLFAVGLTGRILHYDGARWAAMSSGTAAGLLGVWGTSRSNVYAVGDSGTVLRYDGNRWSRLAGPVADRSLRTIWGRGDTLWIAGYQRDAQARTHGLILRSVNGGDSWTETLSTPASGNRQLWGITGAADGALIVSGLQNGTSRGVDDGVILRSTDGGQTWADSTFSEPTHRRLYRVWAQGAHVFAVGEGFEAGGLRGFTVRSADGGVTWTRALHMETNGLYGVWGSGPDDVTAVGFNGAFLHFDGLAWTDVRPAGSAAPFHAIWGTGADDVFAAGNDQSLARRTDGPWVLAPQIATQPTDYVAAWGAAPGDLYVVVRSYDTNSWGTALMRRTAGAWSTVRAREVNLELESIWGSGPGNVLVVGHRYATDHYEGVVLRFDGTRWTETVSASGPDRRFHAVHGDGAGNVWVVGDQQDLVTLVRHALVMRSADGGQTWQAPTRIPVPGYTPQLFDVWGSGPSDVHAVGRAFHSSTATSYGLRLRFDGAQWHHAVESVPSDLVAVWGTGDGTVYAGGLDGGPFSGPTSGLILTSVDSGATWQRATFAPTIGSRRTVNAFWSASPGVVYAAGAGGPMLQKDGTRWEAVGPFTASIRTLWGFSAGDVWALGTSGTVIHGTR
jgi:hypothetical protein